MRTQPDFSREQRAIRYQVLIGHRCVDCLRPFNRGERKWLRAQPNSGMICSSCSQNIFDSTPLPASRETAVLTS